jgi:drug/metabolite transporter (DMT)-like permease
VTLAFYRYVLATLCMLPVLYALWPREKLAAIEVVKIAALGALFFGFFPWAFNASLQYTTAARGAIALATIPVQTLIIAAIFGRESLTRGKLLSVTLAFAGIAVVFGPAAFGASAADYLVGDGLMLAGAFSAAIYSAFSRPVLTRHGAMFVTALAMVFGLLSLTLPAVAHGALAGWPSLSRNAWLALLFLGIIGGAVQFSLFTWALRWLPPSRVVIYLTLNPISAMLLAALTLGEHVTIALLVGLALVLAGILVANWQSPVPQARAESQN